MSSDLLSMLALVIALASTVINYLVLRIQRDPEVVVYALPDPRRPSFINLVLENTGNGIAHDVTFESSRGVPARAFGFDNAPQPESMKDGPLIKGIPSFSRGEKRIITWGQYGGLAKGLDSDVLDITATYFSTPPLRLRRQKHKTISRIDIRSFEGTDASDQNWDKKAAEELAKLATGLTKVTDSSQKSLRITVTHEHADRDQEI